MEYLKTGLVPSTIYNSLPHISENSHTPDSHSEDLQTLRAVLSKHNVPTGISIRLIHKHFNTHEDEIMIFKSATVLDGTVQVMRPIQATKAPPTLQPIHFFLDSNTNTLQAYEYTTSPLPLPSLSPLTPFLQDFIQTLSSLNLHRKFGLKLSSSSPSSSPLDKTSWTEYELPQHRSTITIPSGLPSPADDPDSYSVVTEWEKDMDVAKPFTGRCSHSIQICTHCSHCAHYGKYEEEEEGGMKVKDERSFVVGGRLVGPETEVWGMLRRVVEVW